MACRHEPKLIRLTGPSKSNVSAMGVVPEIHSVFLAGTTGTLQSWKMNKSESYHLWFSMDLKGPGTCIEFSVQMNRIFVGLANGEIADLCLPNAPQQASTLSYMLVHKQSKEVLAVRIHHTLNSLFSTGADGRLVWTDLRARVTIAVVDFITMSRGLLQVDEISSCLYVTTMGDSVDAVDVRTIEPLTLLRAESIVDNVQGITCFKWLPDSRTMFLGCENGSIRLCGPSISKSKYFVLCKHRSPVITIEYLKTNELISISKNGQVVIWDLNISRLPVCRWELLNACSKCEAPFFWNIVSMMKNKKTGSRRHHCRICGLSLCENHCSKERSAPAFGYEFPVRLCSECSERKDLSNSSFCESFDTDPNLDLACIDLESKKMLTYSSGCNIQCWDLSKTL